MSRAGRLARCLGLLALLAMQAVIAEAADGYSVPSGATATISEHGICRRVTNAIAGGHGLFVPTRFLMEWANNPVSFLSNTIPGVSLAACLDAMSVRFRAGAGAHLTRAASTAGNRTRTTFSAWVKRGSLSGVQTLFNANASSGFNGTHIAFSADGKLQVRHLADAVSAYAETNAVFRDPAAWYHIVVAWDTPHATAAERLTIFVNGERASYTFTQGGYTQNQSIYVNGVFSHFIGRRVSLSGGHVEYFDGYMAGVSLIDGQALDAAAFGERDPATGQWVPKAYAGAYGTNGFNLNFGSLANLGADTSGNGNNWTANNISTASGISHDAMGDASHPVSAQGNGFGNYATLNPLSGLTNPTFSEGNLAVTFPTGTNARAMATKAVDVSDPAGYYWEHTLSTNAAIHGNGGFITEAASALSNSYYSDGSYAFSADGSFYGNGALVMGGLASVTTNDVVGFGIRSGNVYLYKNGVVMNNGNPVLTGLTGRVFPALWRASSTGAPSFYFNTGQRPFHAGLPAGFKTLNTHSLPAPAVVTPSAFFKTVTYTGNGSFQQIGTPPALTGGASIAHSARFRAESSAYMTRTPGAGNRRIWTWSGWVKRSGVDSTQSIFSAYGGNGGDLLYFNSDNALRWYASGTDYKRTSRRFRDEGQWSHIVLAVDTTNATAADRYRLFVDGLRITAFSTDANPSLNFDSSVNSTVQHELGRFAFNSCCTFNGYFADVYFVDGQSLDASSFGQFNSAGVWVPITYAGSYGTNGFRLNFSNSAAMGADSSGNGNNFTVHNMAASDQMTDTPTGNYPTWNPLHKGPSLLLSEGNLSTAHSANNQAVLSSIVFPAGGRYYFEYTVGAINIGGGWEHRLGMTRTDVSPNLVSAQRGDCGVSAYSYCFLANGGSYSKYSNSSFSSYGPAWANGNVIGVAVDLVSNKIWFSINGTWQAGGDPAAGTNEAFAMAPGDYRAHLGYGGVVSGNTGVTNFGQRPFVHSPPAGFAALNASNISTTDFVPDLAIIKSRSAATDWAWYDRERGATLDIASNLTSAETVQSGGLLGFNAGGFNVGNLAKVNTSGASYIAYLFKKGVTPGFDIVTYVGNGGNQNIPHGLGQVPAMFVTKALGAATYPNWISYHQSMSASPHLGAISLNATSAYSAGSGFWNDTAPTTSNFRVGSVRSESGMRYVAYIFAEVPGFSKFGRYTGNGSADGPFIHTGFKPAFVMMKRIDSTENWIIKDGARQGYNPRNDSLYPNLANAEGDDSQLDLLSNGFKLRNTTAGGNVVGATYIYAAFAESPFKYSNAR